MSFSFKPLFKLLVDRDMTAEDLRKALGFSFSTMAKMKKGEYVSLEVLDKICNYLHCNLSDVLKHVPDNKQY
ncbi:helix-turn-helix domain-containing protein [Desulfitobacterium metallireducens]|uniref:XRE family transcriptional regulator n=1 Tax=Desulfitobacterium metallireducens DSM 15288 TaxID=871968 RepID=W0E8L3_9FIRM|nr:helix-turn-helix transcriptional regulator [Desulfitobacterium metallireducens]AHF07175.1 XRE family transcriptional regulator [Desulfitobacterium metallireducens DSM 15288]